jgi:hypothetical protein
MTARSFFDRSVNTGLFSLIIPEQFRCIFISRKSLEFFGRGGFFEDCEIVHKIARWN